MRALRNQLGLFTLAPKTADEQLNDRLAAGDRARMARERTRPESVAGVRCTHCGRGNFADAVTCRSCEEPLARDAPPASREQLRSLGKLRDRPVRAMSVRPRHMKRAIAVERLGLGLEAALMSEPEELPKRPKTRAGCEDVPRPCPFVSCPHHTYLDVSARTGALKLNFPELEPHEMHPDESCALDVAGAHPDGATLEEVGRITNLTRERIRQIEVKTLAKLGATHDLAALREFYGIGLGTKRRLPMLEREQQEKRDEDRPKPDDEFDAEEFAGSELDDDV